MNERAMAFFFKYHLILVTMSISKIFYAKLCVCSHKEKIENIWNRKFHCVDGVMTQG